MFLHLSVSHSVPVGVCLSACWDIPPGQTPWEDTPWADTPYPVHVGIHSAQCMLG